MTTNPDSTAIRDVVILNRLLVMAIACHVLALAGVLVELPLIGYLVYLYPIGLILALIAMIGLAGRFWGAKYAALCAFGILIPIVTVIVLFLLFSRSRRYLKENGLVFGLFKVRKLPADKSRLETKS